MGHDVKRQRRIFPTEPPGDKHQMAGARNRQEFSGPLQDTEKNCFYEIHTGILSSHAAASIVRAWSDGSGPRVAPSGARHASTERRRGKRRSFTDWERGAALGYSQPNGKALTPSCVPATGS